MSYVLLSNMPIFMYPVNITNDIQLIYVIIVFNPMVDFVIWLCGKELLYHLI